MLKNIILTTGDPGKNIGGGKAKEDISKIFSDRGYISKQIPIYTSKIKKYLYLHTKMKKDIDLVNVNRVVFQYPTSSVRMTREIINYIANSDVELVLFIHDISSLQEDGNTISEYEIGLLSLADKIIVHNDIMKKILEKNKISSKILVLGIFDYLTDFSPKSKEYDKTVCFAGNLFKSTFLQKLTLRKHKVDVYGPNKLDNYPECIDYNGQFSPEELPKHLNQSFGLIWDGDSIETCEGHYGEYMKFNNPHKTSLYITTGLPILIWREAAMAKFVVDNNIGIAIDSLIDLDKILDDVTVDKYRVMRKNVLELSKDLKNGNYTKRIVKELDRIQV